MIVFDFIYIYYFIYIYKNIYILLLHQKNQRNQALPFCACKEPKMEDSAQ